MIVGAHDIPSAVPVDFDDSLMRSDFPITGSPYGVAKVTVRLDGLGSGSGSVTLIAKVYGPFDGTLATPGQPLLATSLPVTVNDGDAPAWIDFRFDDAFEFDEGDGTYDAVLSVVTGDPSSARVWAERDGWGKNLTVSGNELTDATRLVRAQGDTLTPPGGFGIWEGTTNLVTNGGFEGGTTGWSLGGAAASFAATTLKTLFGSKSGALVSGGSSTKRDLVSTVATTVAGLVYTASKWLYIPSGWDAAMPTLVARFLATLSGNEVTDANRLTQGDGNVVTNLCVNGGFETNLTAGGKSWLPIIGPETVVRNTAFAKFGIACARITTPGSVVNEGIYQQATTVSVGRTYTISVWVKAPLGATLRLTMGAPAVAHTDFVGTGAWQRVTVTGVASSSSHDIEVATITTAQAITYYLDGVQLEAGSTASDYIETNGAAVTAAVDSSLGIWEGTTNLIPNGGFETNTTGWTLGTAAASIVQSAVQALFGTKSGLLTSGGSSSKRDLVAASATTVAGTTYTASLWAWLPSSWDAAMPAIVARFLATLSGNEITDASRTTATQGDARTVTNLVPNGGFETNTTGWAGTSGATISRDATVSKFGGASLKAVMGGGGTQDAEMSTTISVFGGQSYTASVWVKAPVGNAMQLELFYGVRATQIQNFTATGAWQRVTLTDTPPANDTVKIAVEGPGDGSTVWIDGVQFEAGSAANDYVETNGAAATVGEDSSMGVWEGTTNLVPNGGFEGGTTSWTVGVAAASLVQSAARAIFGTKSGLITTGGSSQKRDLATTTATTVAGTTYTGSMWAWIPTAWDAAMPALVARFIATLSGNEITDASRTTNTQGDGRTITNLCTNGGFESNTTGWARNIGTETISRDTTVSKFGTASFKIITPGGVTHEGVFLSPGITLTGGKAYTVSAWVKAPVGATMLIALDGTMTLTPFTGTGAWQKVSSTSTPGATGSYQAEFYTVGAQAITYWIDGVQVEAGSTANDYVETNGASALVGEDSSVGVWEGTTNVVTNGGFETNTTGWAAKCANGSSLTRITTDKKFGAACGQFSVTGGW